MLRLRHPATFVHPFSYCHLKMVKVIKQILTTQHFQLQHSVLKTQCSSRFDTYSIFWWGILGSPRHSPHLWFIPLVHLDFLAIFVIPSPHLDIHTFTSPRGLVIPAPHLDLHTLTSPRGLVIPKGAKIQKIRSLLGSRAQLG